MNTLIRLFRHRREAIVGILGIQVAMLLYMLDRFGAGALAVLGQRPLLVLAGIVGAVSFFFYVKGLFFHRPRYYDDSFISVDKRNTPESLTLDQLRSELKARLDHQQDVNYRRVAELLEERKKLVDEQKIERFEHFNSYFASIVQLLEEKARIADEKASILLDKGTFYSKMGIVFFVLSIVAWQALGLRFEFKPQFIYGIVSCSVLFAFIEFLSAWFLRQYRHFVDTSTYLIKVKTLLDRYMLAYLAISKKQDSNGGLDAQLGPLLTHLSADLAWPDFDSMKRGDESFAKEAIQSLTEFTKYIKAERGKA